MDQFVEGLVYRGDPALAKEVSYFPEMIETADFRNEMPTCS